MTAITRFAQFEHGTTRHHFAAMAQEGFQHLFQVEQTWLAIHQRHHVHTEGILQLCLLVEVV